MRFIMHNGGMGNQIFQYIFMRYLELQTGEQCIIDDLAFQGAQPEHNGYELERVFSIHHPRISTLFEPDVIQEIHRLIYPPADSGRRRASIISVFQTCGIDLFPVQEGDFYLQVYPDYQGPIFSLLPNHFSPEAAELQGDLYYFGYWINPLYLGHTLDPVLQELTFPPLEDPQNRGWMEQIRSAAERSVSLHVRRGDFVKRGWTTDLSFYQRSLDSVRQKISHPVYFLFSDDIPWVRDHLADLGFLPGEECILIEGNDKGKNYIDMQLMSCCKNMIICASSFSYLAALLNRQEDKLIFNPVSRLIL